MIALANFDDRESLVAHFERCASDDAARLCQIESEKAVEEVDLEADDSDSGQESCELAVEAETAEDAAAVSDSDESEDMVIPEEYEELPMCLSDVSDYEDDGQEAASSPQYDPDAHYPWIDRVLNGTAKADESVETPAGKANEIELPSDPIERLQVLVTAAKYGDDEAFVQIRQCLDEHPEIWQRVGDLAAHAESLLIEIIAEGNQMVTESMEREVQRLKFELTEGEPSPLERLTIQRIVAAWLHAQYVDRATLAADAAGSRAAAWGRRQESAERRFQAAIKSLDTVRRLRPKALPPAAAESPCTDQDTQESRAATKTVKRPESVASWPEPAGKMSWTASNRFAPMNRIKQIAPAEKEPVA